MHGERVGEVGVIRLVEERLGAVAPDGVEASEGSGRGGAVVRRAGGGLSGGSGPRRPAPSSRFCSCRVMASSSLPASR